MRDRSSLLNLERKVPRPKSASPGQMAKAFSFPITQLPFPMITKALYVFYAALPPWPHNRIMNNFYKFTKTNHMAGLKVC